MSRPAPSVDDPVARTEPAAGVPRHTAMPVLLGRRILRNRGSLVGFAMLAAVLVFAAAGDLGNPYAYDQQDLLALGSPPGVDGHRLGTDAGGFDLWAMLVRGTGRSLVVAVVAGIGAPLVGTVYGAAVALRGGLPERIGVGLIDLMLLLPSFLLVAMVMGGVGSTGGTDAGVVRLAVVLALLGWAGVARVAVATTRSLRERDYVRAARHMGVSEREILRRHLLPNLGSYLVVSIVLGTFGAIMAETTLSFLGVGVRPPDVSLGRLVAQSASQLTAYPWLFWGPTLCLTWITIALALVGDGVRDALDPAATPGGRP